MVTRAIAYFRKRNIQCQDGTFMWHNLQWGTSKTGMARWHAASTDQIEPIIHAADDRSNVQLPDGIDKRKRSQQGEAPCD
eukprot:2402361-Amphidinium_carterae.2